ncbi:hypothetical protein [uncultured Lactobacillus sp.]|uniref:hypothetical protein n=1 Tax=uncultured Lactobacillus sp. TaxID=153152 RepID=UPI0025875C0B|nr:hypothetical protein [uncultured Lactobacillus sp.]
MTGAKVKVKNINDINANETEQIFRVMNDYYTSGRQKTSVSIYQHWTHKDAY